jgi:hypothetical protein
MRSRIARRMRTSLKGTTTSRMLMVPVGDSRILTPFRLFTPGIGK